MPAIKVDVFVAGRTYCCADHAAKGLKGLLLDAANAKVDAPDAEGGGEPPKAD